MSQFSRPRKRFGQHFLHDSRVIETIIRATTTQDTNHIVEIGPGRGAITAGLSQHNAQLTVIEVDRELAAFHRRAHPDANIIESDVLDIDLLALEPRPYNLVGNLPYNISTPIIFKLVAARAALNIAVLMLQKEVVERLCANAGETHRGRLSVGVQRYFHTERLINVKPGAFNPPPRVDSAVLILRPRNAPVGGECNETLFNSIVRDAFGQRRKTLRNALKKTVDDSIFIEADIDPTLRPEMLSVEEFVRLTVLVERSGH